MNRRKKEQQRKIIIIITVLIIAFSVFSLLVGRTATGIEYMLKNTVTSAQYYVIEKPIEFVGSIFNEYTELKDVYKENKILKQQLDNYSREQALNDELSEEIQNLKEITGIDYLPSEYKIKYASVASRDANAWESEFTLNIGSQSNVKEGMAVVSSEGMIGSVTEVDAVSSTVTLLCSSKYPNQLPVQIKNGDETLYGLLTSYDSSTSTYTITLLSKTTKIKKNATVTTSGLGGDGKTPKGILIGTATKMTSSKDGTGTIVKVEPAAQFDDISYVAVVQKVNGDEK